jgi:ribosomal protein L31E
MHTQLNQHVPLKLISSGSNFDIVFYKAFMSYYLQFLGPMENRNKKEASKAFKTKKIQIGDDLSRKLAELGSKAQLHLEYLELMSGFYIVVGTLNFKSNIPRIRLIVNKQFKTDKYIISPELVNLL